jgi:hypothetical protein
MTDEDHVKLLFGPYTPPALKLGDRIMCLYRDTEVVIYGWSMAPIPWPLCYHVGTRAFGKGLLVDGELARAVCLEAALAVGQMLGAGRKNNPGTQRLIHAAVAKASASREIMQHRCSE